MLYITFDNKNIPLSIYNKNVVNHCLSVNFSRYESIETGLSLKLKIKGYS
jgi:hypothetical protein